MDRQYPIYTVETECQDCYKCVRHCPVKAIRIVNGHANAVPELCIACGRCVKVCPAKAKRVRDDLGRTRSLVNRHETVYVSLAPSWVSEFDGVTAQQTMAALRQLGFAGVSETALGAQQVSFALAEKLRRKQPGLLLSSACPVCVSYIQKYHPHLVEAIAAMHSPALAHAQMLHEELGEQIGVVFIGPCIAKKLESDRHPELINIALTFEEFQRWLDEEGIVLENMKASPDEHFALADSQEGALYPIEGGMSDTIKALGGFNGVEFVTISGMGHLEESLSGLSGNSLRQPVLIECLACEGGCVNGPGRKQENNPLIGRMRVIEHSAIPETIPARKQLASLEEQFASETVPEVVFSDQQITEALARIGKTREEDEMNCGGCGYNTCREFANAMLAGKGEPAMCASFMRRQAHRKANALLRCMPSGSVIVNADLHIIESNESFARIFGEESILAFNASKGMAGANLEKVLPFANVFRDVLKSDKDAHHEHMIVGDKMLNVTVFTIEPHQVVGAIIEDVTTTELRREQIAQKAREVINRNISTVQEIAFQLGENMADTEILLRSIADDYSDTSLPGQPRKG